MHIHLRDFFGFTTCITITDIQEILFLQDNNDGWNIESIVTFVIVNQSECEMTSADFDVFEWIDGDSAEAYIVSSSINRPMYSFSQCYGVYTSGEPNADGGVDTVH